MFAEVKHMGSYTWLCIPITKTPNQMVGGPFLPSSRVVFERSPAVPYNYTRYTPMLTSGIAGLTYQK